MKKKFSTPRLVKYDDLKKTWYVYFRYQLPDGTGKLVKLTGGINVDYKTYEERLQAGEALAKYTFKQLKKGWNPLVNDVAEKTYTFPDALKIALEKKKKHVAAITYKNYRCTLNFLIEAIESLNLSALDIKQVKRVHIKQVLEHISDKRGWSNKAYNKAMTHIQALFTELLQWDIVEYSPADKIRRLDESETEEKVYLTDKERVLLKNHLADKHINFFKFLMMIYHTGLRPVEITRLKFSMLDKKNKMIVLPVGEGKIRTKRRKIALPNEMWEYLAPWLCIDYPDDYYLFGSDRISGRGNEGNFADFQPGKTQLKRDTATKRYKKLIMEDLGINMRMYWFKSMGTNDKLAAGISPETIQNQLGHSEKKTTEIYMTLADKLRYQEIQEKSPNF